MLRTHTCGELTKAQKGKEVKICGWVQTRRDHGGVIFVDLRDKYGLTQIVFEPTNKQVFKIAEHLRREDVISVKGNVRKRPKGLENLKLNTGKIEVLVGNLEIINKAEVPPIEIDDRVESNEEMRLKYRYLDLRRPSMQKKMELRHNVITASRNYFNKNNVFK